MEVYLITHCFNHGFYCCDKPPWPKSTLRGKEFVLSYNFQVKIYYREKSSRNSKQELKLRLWRNEADLIVFYDFAKSACLFNSGQPAQVLHCSIMNQAHLSQWLIEKILHILAHRPIWWKGWSYHLFSNNCSLYWVNKKLQTNKETIKALI